MPSKRGQNTNGCTFIYQCLRNILTTNLYCNLKINVRGKTRSSQHTLIKMDGLITSRGFHGRRRNTPQHARVCINEKNMGSIGLLSSGRVGSIDGEIRSTTWVSFSKGRMGSTGGKGLNDWVSLSNGRVGSTEDGIRSTTWVRLSNGRVGSTEDGIGSTTNPGGYRWPPTFFNWLKTIFWQFTIFNRF